MIEMVRVHGIIKYGTPRKKKRKNNQRIFRERKEEEIMTAVFS
jgi:hypothetical protein